MAEIIELGEDLVEDTEYKAFLANLQEGTVKGTFYFVKGDTIFFGSRNRSKHQLIADIYRLQNLAQHLVAQISDDEEEDEDETI